MSSPEILFSRYAIRLKISFIVLLSLLVYTPSFAQEVVNFKGDFGVIGDKLEILVDSNSTITLAEAINAKNYTASPGKFPNLGISTNSYWIRFQLKNEINHSNLAIQIPQPMIDNITFYQLKGDSIIMSNKSGQSMPFDSRLIGHQYYIFPIIIADGSENTILMHINSGKQLVLPVYAGTIEQIVESTLTKDIIFGIYTGIILVMLLYNLFIYTSTRDKSYLYYVSYLLMVLISQVCMEGYFFRFVLPNSPHVANVSIYIAAALIGLAAIEFAKNFLSAKQYTPKMHKYSRIFWFLYGTQIILALTGHYNISYGLMLSVAMMSALYVQIMAVIIMTKGFRGAKFFLLAWTFFILCVVVYVLKDFNILPYNSLTSSSLLIGSAFEAILLSFALADKINIFKAEKERSQEETLKALQENERIIREQNTVLEIKVNERTVELSESNMELGRTLDNLKEAQSQLVESEKMASLGQLTAGIAHEINNPINFVTANVKPLRRDVDMLFEAFAFLENISLSDAPVNEKQHQISEYKEELDFDYLTIEINDLLKGIKEGADRTAEIVKGLKIFSRLDEDDLKVADLNEGLESTLVIANNLFNNTIKVNKVFGEIPPIECYAGKLNQVFLNIISNGVYAVHKQFGEKLGGEITITTTNDEEFVYIDIKDNGTGMEEKTQKKIFEPFFTTKDVGEGTGLGMSIAYNTVKKHNGQLHLTSVLGEGTTFRLQLPIIFKVIPV